MNRLITTKRFAALNIKNEFTVTFCQFNKNIYIYNSLYLYLLCFLSSKSEYKNDF